MNLWTRSVAVPAALAATALLAACPPGSGALEASAFFEPDPLDLGEFRAVEGLPDSGTFSLRNTGADRLSIHSLSAADPWFEVQTTTDAEMPVAVDPDGWLSIDVLWVGAPGPGRTDYGSTVTAEVSPPRGERAFAEVILITGGVELGITCDADGDGHAAAVCGGADCDDLDPDHSPDTVELCNGLDEDCDGVADASGTEVDDDGDGYLACEECDDDDPGVHPGAVERCNGVDDDCDPATVPEGGEIDFDTDGYLACEECDDMDHDNAPGNVEVCDGADNDCDGLPSPLELDDDGDSWTECEGDCDDTTLTTHPFAEDPPGDGVDSDCDGAD
jgi:hypothetical protein